MHSGNYDFVITKFNTDNHTTVTAFLLKICHNTSEEE